MNVQTLEQWTLYPSKCDKSACGLNFEHELQKYLRNVCVPINTTYYQTLGTICLP